MQRQFHPIIWVFTAAAGLWALGIGGLAMVMNGL